MYLARGCHRSYCAWSAFPIASSAFCGCIDSGLIQHCMRAHGDIFKTSGGSTPMFKHKTSATDVVFIRSFIRHFDTTFSRDVDTSEPSSLAPWRSSVRNIGYIASCISGVM